MTSGEHATHCDIKDGGAKTHLVTKLELHTLPAVPAFGCYKLDLSSIVGFGDPYLELARLGNTPKTK